MSKEYTIQEVFKFLNGTIFQIDNDKCEVVKGRSFKMLRDERTGDLVAITSFNINARYTLVRKELTFFEAMKLVDEGKIVENEFGCKFKKISGLLRYYVNNTGKWENGNMSVSEINGKWYEVEEE